MDEDDTNLLKHHYHNTHSDSLVKDKVLATVKLQSFLSLGFVSNTATMRIYRTTASPACWTLWVKSYIEGIQECSRQYLD